MIKMTGVIKVEMAGGHIEEFKVDSPGSMVALAKRLSGGDVHLVDHHNDFIEECVDISRHHKKDVNALEIVNTFVAWCKAKNIRCPVGRNRLYALLEDYAEVVRTKPHNKTCFRGIKLLGFDEQEPNDVIQDLI